MHLHEIPLVSLERLTTQGIGADPGTKKELASVTNVVIFLRSQTAQIRLALQ